MINFIVYSATGEILRSGLCQKSMLNSQGDFVIEGVANDSSDYIKGGKVTPRPLFDVAIDGLTIMGVPVNTSVYIDGELSGQCDTGAVSIEKENQLDTVSVRLSLFPYIDKEITL